MLGPHYPGMDSLEIYYEDALDIMTSLHTMSINSGLKGDNGPLRLYSILYLFRHLQEAMIGVDFPACRDACPEYPGRLSHLTQGVAPFKGGH